MGIITAVSYTHLDVYKRQSNLGLKRELDRNLKNRLQGIYSISPQMIRTGKIPRNGRQELLCCTYKRVQFEAFSLMSIVTVILARIM